MLDLQTISDRIEIADLLTRYTRAIDTGEWDRLDEVFTPDAYIDYTVTGGIEGGFLEVKAWLAEMLPRFPGRHHVLGQSEVAIDGDKAVHILGLLSDGGVHSHQDHIFAMMKMAVERGARIVRVHDVAQTVRFLDVYEAIARSEGGESV